ncbi:hypothetical protein BDL97_08G130100 [Sphagnum fallax]|nr:hypothetical protein BDL97_08G130100 [Sphagnum fallax]
MTNIQVRSVYFFILSYDHIIILPSPSKSSTLGWKSIKSEALYIITVVETQIFLQIMPPVSDDTFFPTRQEKEVANLCHSLVDLHGNFYYLTTLLFQRKNVGWASKKVSITPAEGQVVFHHCRQHSHNFCSCSSSLDLRSLSFDLIYSNFKSSFLNFPSSLDSIFKLQVKLWELGLKLLVKEALHLNFRYSWLSATDPFELHIIFLKSQNKKRAIFL